MPPALVNYVLVAAGVVALGLFFDHPIHDGIETALAGLSR